MVSSIVTERYTKNPSKLTLDEERELFVKYLRDGDQDARKIIIKSQGILVNKIARKFHKTHKKNDLQDLLQAGFVGLLLATNKFDPSRGVRFSYYAKYWVKREIQNLIRSNLRIAYVPHTFQRETIFIQILKHHNIDEPKDLINIVKQKTDASTGIIKEMIMATLTNDISLNTTISSSKHNILPEDKNELEDILPSKDPTPEEIYQQKELAKTMLEAIMSLKEMEQMLIINKYYKDKSNQELSEKMNRSIISMLNLELKIRNKLKKKLKHLYSVL
ncbi:MAG: sigma-70 family RNA polymerase sigma factor [Magnetococcales bacterium]|nr:sigma-70 family RNA polymerase sigma factor [Magnetococcales bacterium]